MTGTASPGQPEIHVPLGAGTIVGDTFSIFFKKIHLVLLLAFIPALLEGILTAFAISQPLENVATGGGDTASFATTFLVTLIISLVTVAVTTAMVIQLAYDAKLGRPARIGSYFSAAIKNLPAIAVLSIVTTILYSLASIFLLLPGLWVYAVFSVIVPAIVIDGAGFGAMGRSAALTKNYRWPIVGSLILVVLCIMLVPFVIAFAFAALFGFGPDPSGAAVFGPWLIIESAISAISYGWLSIAIALIFARLKEIKEGVSVSDLVDVFK